MELLNVSFKLFLYAMILEDFFQKPFPNHPCNVYIYLQYLGSFGGKCVRKYTIFFEWLGLGKNWAETSMMECRKKICGSEVTWRIIPGLVSG